MWLTDKFYFKKGLTFIGELCIIYHVRWNDAELCKGSTADSDSVCEGSNPSSAARKKAAERLLFSMKSTLTGG